MGERRRSQVSRVHRRGEGQRLAPWLGRRYIDAPGQRAVRTGGIYPKQPVQNPKAAAEIHGREKAPGRGAEWTEGGSIIITDYQDGGWNEETTKQKGANSVGQQQLSGRVDAALPADRGRTDYNKARSEKE